MPRSVDERREKAYEKVRMSDAELRAIANLASKNAFAEAAWAPDTSEEEIKRWQEENERRYEASLAALRQELLDREVDAYLQGVDDTANREAQGAYNTRSLVLLLVVAAVVAMPLLAMLLGLEPQTFGAYVAPVLAIAGTVVGYWFGSADRGTSRPRE